MLHSPSIFQFLSAYRARARERGGEREGGRDGGRDGGTEGGGGGERRRGRDGGREGGREGGRGTEGRRDGGTEGELFLTLHRFYSLGRRRITLKEERLERSGRTSSGSAGKYDACERGRVTALSHQIGMLRC